MAAWNVFARIGILIAKAARVKGNRHLCRTVSHPNTRQEPAARLDPGCKSAARLAFGPTATTTGGKTRWQHLLVLYKQPKSAEAFDKYYAEVHIPLAKKIPGLKKYCVSKGVVGTPAGPSDIHLVATLYFDSTAAI